MSQEVKYTIKVVDRPKNERKKGTGNIVADVTVEPPHSIYKRYRLLGEKEIQTTAIAANVRHSRLHAHPSNNEKLRRTVERLLSTGRYLISDKDKERLGL